MHVSALPETLLLFRYIVARTLFLFAYKANQAAAVVDLSRGRLNDNTIDRLQNKNEITVKIKQGNLKGMQNNIMAALCHPLEVQMNGII